MLESMVGPALPHTSRAEWAPAYYLYDASGQRLLRPDEIPLVRALAGEIVTDAVIATRRHGQPVRHLRCTAAPLFDGDQEAGALVEDPLVETDPATDDDLPRDRCQGRSL